MRRIEGNRSFGFRLRRIGTALAAAGLVVVFLPPAAPPAMAGTLPSVYALGSGGQGMAFLFNFSGSTVDPLVNFAVPYATAQLSSNFSPAGLSTLAYPGTLGLIYQDSLALAASSYGPQAEAFARQVSYPLPKYPLIARADGRERNANVGAPEFSNSDGAMRMGSGRQSCLVADDDSTVNCSAYVTDVTVPMIEALATPKAPAGSEGHADRLAAFDSWRNRVLQALKGLPGHAVATRSEGKKTFASVASIKATADANAAAKPALSEATVILQGVDLLGGVLHFDKVVQRFEATSDGATGTGRATTKIAGARIGDVPVLFGAQGVSIADNAVVGPDQLADANKQLATALESAGMLIRVAQHRDATNGGAGSVEGDGLVMRAQISNQSTTYTIQGWLSSGRAQATRSVDETAAGSEGAGSEFGVPVSSGDGETSSAASGSDGAVPSSAEGSGPVGDAPAGFGSAFAGGSAPSAENAYSIPALERSPSRGAINGSAITGAAGDGSGVSPPAGVSSQTGRAAGVERLAVAPTASIRSDGGFERRTVLALFAIWQFLGLATVAMWGLKVTAANAR